MMRRRIRYALIVAAMAFAWVAGNAAPSQAAPQTEAASSAKPLALGKFSRHRKKHVRHHARSSKKHHASVKHSSKVADKADKDDDAKGTNDAEANDDSLSPSVANAHAELTSPPPEQPMFAQSLMPASSTLTEADKAATTDASANGVQITTSDQLNDMDRDAAATSTTPEPPTVALAQMSQPADATTPGDSAWSSASLIGKIFIAFGVMLMFGSAARMLWPQRAT